ncbi:MAG: DUF1850 domain-containing protein [Tissierellia bacterium]|nr:DUF1850 domain-containing protein [Tissierellia bacterium]
MKKLALNKSKNIDKGIESRFNTLSIKILIIGIILIIIWSLMPIKVLLASDFKDDNYIRAWKISDGDNFIIEHTHSVQLTTVSEKYVVKGQDIILIESRFNSLGAGLPATTPYKFQLTEEGFRIYDINKTIDNLVYRVGAVRANHRLIYDGSQYDFLDFSKPRTGIKFTIDTMPYALYKIREGFN